MKRLYEKIKNSPRSLKIGLGGMTFGVFMYVGAFTNHLVSDNPTQEVQRLEEINRELNKSFSLNDLDMNIIKYVQQIKAEKDSLENLDYVIKTHEEYRRSTNYTLGTAIAGGVLMLLSSIPFSLGLVERRIERKNKSK